MTVKKVYLLAMWLQNEHPRFEFDVDLFEVILRIPHEDQREGYVLNRFDTSVGSIIKLHETQVHWEVVPVCDWEAAIQAAFTVMSSPHFKGILKHYPYEKEEVNWKRDGF